MGPLGGKGKGKGREARRSRSRNTTPSSIGASAVLRDATHTGYLDIPIADIMVPTNPTYDDLMERYGSGSNIPESKNLDSLAEGLRTLARLAGIRDEACTRGMRELAERRKDRQEELRQKEREDREMEERERKEKLRREAVAKEEEEERLGRKGGKFKKRKDRSNARDEQRPLAHGAHGLARQDGVDVHMKDTTLSSEQHRSSKKRGASPSKVKHEAPSASVSSLSPPSQAQSPITPIGGEDVSSLRSSPASSESSDLSHQPPPAPAIPQYQTFGPDPSTFDDPTIYHIRDVKAGMGEDEIKEIYFVSSYPHDDLHDLIPGTPPDKDFSNAKPTNQVAANTFATYIEPYLRPLTEEDMAFLKERGDRVTPFLMPRRGKRHYTEVWAEEDGSISLDSPQQNRDKLPSNQPRGSMEQMSDDIAESEQVSAGPLLNRLLATMRPENRAPMNEEKHLTNGTTNGNGESATTGVTNGELNGDAETNGDAEKSGPLPSATYIPDSQQPGWKVPTTKLDYAQVDERLKAELRYLGFLGSDSEPDYDAHYDDDIAARLRYLQSELKNQSIVNGARKARIQERAKERMAHQEYTTILEDLDNQVQQAYLKRTRTLGKGKKHAKRPGGAGGGSHYVGAGAGISKPGIGDVARQLMERRRNWIDSIGPVFEEGLTRVPGKEESIFGADVMTPMVEKERDGWDDGDD
ncbi:MAG: Transcriptional regulator [Pycnora praestabilis]|nr:MAG: Transcriptional regulator [Pycnora praestabilis]